MQVLHYNWSTGATTKTITVTDIGVYSVEMTRMDLNNPDQGCAVVKTLL
ncbi:MAG: hypothetical protein ACJARX_001115 [Psychroserpens sp.]|jgi:hypothetical protein